MRKTIIFSMILMISLLFGISCSKEKLNPESKIGQDSIIAIKITNPAVKPGEKIMLNLLASGTNIEKRVFEAALLTEVVWNVGNITITANYGNEAEVTLPDEKSLSDVFAASDVDKFITNGYADIKILATLNLYDKNKNLTSTISAEKSLRIIKPSKFEELSFANPEIKQVDTDYKTMKIENGGTIILPKTGMPDKILFQPVIDQSVKNKKYKWIVGKDLSGTDSTLSTSTTKEANITINPKKGLYPVFLVVEDSDSGHNGADFFVFYIAADYSAPADDSDITTDDSLFPDSDINDAEIVTDTEIMDEDNVSDTEILNETDTLKSDAN